MEPDPDEVINPGSESLAWSKEHEERAKGGCIIYYFYKVCIVNDCPQKYGRLFHIRSNAAALID